jgi:transposase
MQEKLKEKMNQYSPEVRERAVRMVLKHAGEHRSRWAAVSSVASKIGCNAATLHGWVKRTEVNRGVRAGVSHLGLRGERIGGSGAVISR